MSRVITQRELRNDSAAILREVEGGATVVIARRGMPVAELRLGLIRFRGQVESVESRRPRRGMIAPVGPNDRHTGRDADLASLTTEQREWAVRSEALWRRAHAIAAAHPDLDPSDVYHALRCLQLSPSRRLAAGLQRGRLRAHAR